MEINVDRSPTAQPRNRSHSQPTSPSASWHTCSNRQQQHPFWNPHPRSVHGRGLEFADIFVLARIALGNLIGRIVDQSILYFCMGLAWTFLSCPHLPCPTR